MGPLLIRGRVGENVDGHVAGLGSLPIMLEQTIRARSPHPVRADPGAEPTP